VENNAFEGLENEYDCYYIGSGNVTIREHLILKSNFLGFYKEDKEQNQRAFDYFNILMYKYRHKSSSFIFRIMRTFYLSKSSFTHPVKTLISQATSFKFDLLKKYLAKTKLRFLDSSLLFNKHRNNFEKSHLVNPDLLSAIKATKPSLVIFPSSAYDPAGIDVVKLCRTFKIPSFFLIDNWDNLSSKSILFEKPDYLGVWSQQSLEHAVKIQDFKESNIFILGTPRFDLYFSKRDTNIDSLFPFRYVLFVGTALAFDEAAALEKIDEIIENNKDLFEGVKVVYRPHPWRHGSDTIAGKNLSHVILDPQLESAYLEKNFTTSVQPSLDYYPSLIKNAEFVMGGLTTMLIEVLIFRKPYLALVHDDGVNLTSPHNAFKYFEHFKGLEKIEAINFCYDLQDLPAKFVEQWHNKDPSDAKKIDFQREYYLFQDEKINYKDKLKSVTQKILLEMPVKN
jgi:hypothetical protein